MSKTASRKDATAPARAGARVHSMSFDPGNVSFGRHESFPLRFAWIAKGLDALRDDPGAFTREDATVVLGVGKNMVSSIRYWLQAASLIRPRPGGGYVETSLARTAFGEDGDPYLEDDATIWLVHWLLATNPSGATAVYWFFNHFHKPAFATDEVAASLAGFADREAAARTSPATLDRDAEMLLRMYVRTAAGNRVDARHRRSAPALRTELPLPVFAFAVAELFRHLDAPHIAVADLMYSDRSRCAPGAVFRMTEEGLIRKLEELRAAAPGDYRLDRTAGVHQLYALRDVDPLAVLAGHYAGRGRAAA